MLPLSAHLFFARKFARKGNINPIMEKAFNVDSQMLLVVTDFFINDFLSAILSKQK